MYDVVGSLATTAGTAGATSQDPSCTPVQSAQGATALAYSFIIWVYQIVLVRCARDNRECALLCTRCLVLQAILIVVGLGNKPMNDQKLWPRVTFVLSFINAITIVIVLTQVRAFRGRSDVASLLGSTLTLSNPLLVDERLFVCRSCHWLRLAVLLLHLCFHSSAVGLSYRIYFVLASPMSLCAAFPQRRFFQILHSVAHYTFIMPLYIVRRRAHAGESHATPTLLLPRAPQRSSSPSFRFATRTTFRGGRVMAADTRATRALWKRGTPCFVGAFLPG